MVDLENVRIGDRLIVKSNLQRGIEGNNIYVTAEMIKFAGSIVTVIRKEWADYEYCVRIEEDGTWKWTGDLFDCVVSSAQVSLIDFLTKEGL